MLVRILIMVVGFCLIEAFVSTHALSAAKKELPPIIVTGTVSSTTDSSSPDQNTVIYTQAISLGPFQPSFSVNGHTVAMRLSYKMTNEVQEIKRASGRTSGNFQAELGFRDYYERFQGSLGITQSQTLFVSGGEPGKTATNAGNSITFGIAQVLARSARLTAQARLDTTNTGILGQESFSETFTGSYAIEGGEGGLNYRFDKLVSRSKTQDPNPGRSAETTVVSWAYSKDTPIGQISTSYELTESAESPLIPGGGTLVSSVENFLGRIQGKAGGRLAYEGSFRQRRQTPPEGAPSEDQNQGLKLNYPLSLGKLGSGTLSFNASVSHRETGEQQIGVEDIDYSLTLNPSNKITIVASTSQKDTTNLREQKLRQEQSSSTARITFSPHSRFRFIGETVTAETRDFPDGAKSSSNTWNLVTRLQPVESFALSFSVGNMGRETVSGLPVTRSSRQDSSTTSARLTYSPKGKFNLSLNYDSTAYRSLPGGRTTQSLLFLSLDFPISPNIFWRLELQGRETRDRDNPSDNVRRNVVTSTFTMKF